MDPEKKSKGLNNVIVFALITIIIGAGCFYGGLVYGKNRASVQPNFARFGQMGQVFGNQAGQGFRQFNRANRPDGNFINGEIIGQDDKGITVKLPDGGSKIIFIAGTTQISKSAAGSAADLTPGQAVMINGTANSDGSITAQLIQIRSPRPATSTPN